MDKLARLHTRALQKQFAMVGATYTLEFCQQPEWYRKFSWSTEDQARFTEWFIDQFVKLGYSREFGAKQAGMFVLNYGWTTTESSTGVPHE